MPHAYEHARKEIDEFAQIALDGIAELQAKIRKQEQTIEDLSRELAASNAALDHLDGVTR